MSNVATNIGRVAASLALGAMLATSASAALRVPQVVVNGGSLQGYLNSKGESINVLTDQNAAQTWASTVSHTAADWAGSSRQVRIVGMRSPRRADHSVLSCRWGLSAIAALEAARMVGIDR